jgi:hypothetical protein
MGQHIKEVASGKIDYPFGQNPTGLLVYTKGGGIAVTSESFMVSSLCHFVGQNNAFFERRLRKPRRLI